MSALRRYARMSLATQLLMSQIWVLIHDYAGSAVDEFKLLLDGEEDKELLEFVESLKIALFNYLDTKILIKEFNPEISMAKMFNEFTSKFRVQTGEEMTKAQESSDSFLNLVSKIVVTRGRGFKISGSNTGIAEMSTVSVGFSLPRSYFITPEKLDWDIAFKANENYKNTQTTENE